MYTRHIRYVHTHTYVHTELQRLLLEGAIRQGKGPVQERHGAREEPLDRLSSLFECVRSLNIGPGGSVIAFPAFHIHIYMYIHTLLVSDCACLNPATVSGPGRQMSPTMMGGRMQREPVMHWLGGLIT